MNSTFQLSLADPRGSPKGAQRGSFDLLRMLPPLGLGVQRPRSSEQLPRASFPRTDSVDGSGSIGSHGRLDQQAENLFSDLGARAGRRPASLWEAQGAEPEGTVPRLRPAPARTSSVQLAAEGRRGAKAPRRARRAAKEERMGLGSAARAARLPLPLFSLSGTAPRPPGERSAEQPTSTSLLMSASAAASE